MRSTSDHACLGIGMLLCLSVSIAQEKKLTPQALVFQHLQSIGNPDLLAKIQSRAFTGTAAVRFIQGSIGDMTGQSQFASEGRKLGIIMRFPAQDYRGEHFASDGEDVTIGRYVPGKISIFAEFINRFDGFMKEGLLGGILSMAWPLRNYGEVKQRLKYNKANLEGRPVHALEYRAKGGLGAFKILLYFDPETFHHIRTEYKLNISAAMSRGRDRPDVHYLVSEEFADFKEVDGLTLPHRYTIGFSAEEQARTFIAYWTLQAEQWVHNGQIDPGLFRAPKF